MAELKFKNGSTLKFNPIVLARQNGKTRMSYMILKEYLYQEYGIELPDYLEEEQSKWQK